MWHRKRKFLVSRTERTGTAAAKEKAVQIFFGIKRPKAFIANSILRQNKEYQRLICSLPDPTTPEILASNRAILDELAEKILRADPHWPEVEKERKLDAIREARGEFSDERPPLVIQH
jgi:hypothetical protein